MRTTHLSKAVILTGLLVATSAYAAPCNKDAGEKQFDEQHALTKTEKACAAKPAKADDDEEAEVSWYDWAFDGHRAPSFHFIDLLELLGVRG